MGKGVAEIANMLSIPELFLILRRDALRRAELMRSTAVSNILAAAAPWSKEAAKRANNFIQSLTPEKPASEKESSNELIRLFAESGIPIVKE